ncbi:MAG: hypothetical protein H8Z69_05825 [Nanohaloarchaea archaeon]|nr:hypothetical protein [Candidatus Nanohaloarchaea archaeon]
MGRYQDHLNKQQRRMEEISESIADFDGSSEVTRPLKPQNNQTEETYEEESEDYGEPTVGEYMDDMLSTVAKVGSETLVDAYNGNDEALEQFEGTELYSDGELTKDANKIVEEVEFLADSVQNTPETYGTSNHTITGGKRLSVGPDHPGFVDGKYGAVDQMFEKLTNNRQTAGTGNSAWTTGFQEYMDSDKTQLEIGEEIGASQPTVSIRIGDWRDEGLESELGEDLKNSLKMLGSRLEP